MMPKFWSRQGFGQRLALIAVLMLGFAPLMVSPSDAIEIRVRGASRIDASVQSAGSAVQVVGVLRDELEQPLPQRSVLLQVEDKASKQTMIQKTLVTNMQGRFIFQEEMPPAAYDITLSFKPTEHLEGSIMNQALKVRRMPPQVSLSAPKFAVGSSQAINLRVRASVGGVGLASPVQVAVNSSQIKELELDPYGRGVVDLRKFLTPGENQIEVTLPRGTFRPETSSTTTLVFAQGAQFEDLNLDVGYRNIERGLVVSGRVRDPETKRGIGQGSVRAQFEYLAPLQNQALKSPVDPLQNTPSTSAEVSDSGQFRLFVPARQLPNGTWSATVVYRPDAGDQLTATTSPLVLNQTSSRWWLNALGLLALILGGAALLQFLVTGQARDFLAKFLGRSGSGADESLELNLEEEEQIVIEQLQAPLDVEVDHNTNQVSGVIWDSWRRRSIPHAKMQFSLVQKGSEVAHEIVANEEGRFLSPHLDKGAWDLRVEAKGFAPGVMTIKIPHDGSLRFFRLNLVAIPWKIRRFYQKWVRQVYGEDLWGRLSPREIEGVVWDAFEDASSTLASPNSRQMLRTQIEDWLTSLDHTDALSIQDALVSLTELVEEAYFSARVYDEQLWQVLVNLVSHLNRLREPGQEAPR